MELAPNLASRLCFVGIDTLWERATWKTGQSLPFALIVLSFKPKMMIFQAFPVAETTIDGIFRICLSATHNIPREPFDFVDNLVQAGCVPHLIQQGAVVISIASRPDRQLMQSSRISNGTWTESRHGRQVHGFKVFSDLLPLGSFEK